MAKKKKKDDIKNTLLNVAGTAKNIAIKSNSDTFNNAKNVSVPRPTTTLSNATNKVLSSSNKTSSVQKPVIKAPNVSSVSSSPKIQQMSENSAKWHQAEIQKRLPNANVAALTQKQQELHNQNVKLAGNSLKFNPSGTWKNPISGQKAYDIGKVNQNSVFLPYLPSVETLKTENTSKVTSTPVTSELKLPFDPNAKSVMIGGKEYKIADTARVPSIITSNNKSEIEHTLNRARALAFSTIDSGSKEEAQKLLDTITSNYNDYKGKADDLEQIMYGLNARTQSKLSNALNYVLTQTTGSLAALGQTLTKPSTDFISDIGGIKEFLTTSGADLQTKYQKGDYENNAVSADTFAAKELAKAEMARNNVLRETEGITKNLAEFGLMAADTVPTLALSLIPQVGPALSATMIGAKSAGQKAFELQQHGVGATEALQRGLLSGGIDMLTSKFSIDNFLKSFSQKGAKNVIKNILTQAGAEAGDETSSYVLNYLADKAAKDPNATFSVDELAKIAIMSGTLGGLMGGTVSGINAITSRGLNNIADVNTDIANTNANGRNMDNILFPPLEKTIAEYYTGDAIGDTQNINSIRQLSTEQILNDNSIQVPILRTIAENHINNTISDVNPIRVGKATTIQKPYNGKTPVTSQQNLNRQSIHIDNNLLNNAQTIIDDAKQSQTFAKNIKTALKNIFQQSGGSRLVTVDNLYFDGKNYSVSIPARVFSKVASDHSMSSEKLAAFSKLDEIISTAQYVGSGHYNKNKNKASNVIRYDYFENLLDINNQNYIVTFDVEVFRDTNNFRTYRVINEIDLTPTAASRRSKTDGLTTAVSGLSDSIVSHNNNQDNTTQVNGNINVTPPTLRTVAENHINESIAKAQNAQNASLLSNQPLQNNTSVNVENVTSIKPLQVPTLRTVAENHINEIIAQNTQNTTNSQPSVQPQTVGQIIDNAIADSQANTNKSKMDISETSNETITNDLLASWQEVKALDKQIAAFEERVNFTGNDLDQIESSLLSGDTSTLYRADNPQDALYMVELKAKRNAAHQPIAEYNQKFKDNLWSEVSQDADVFFNYAKDKTFGLQYSTETPERNIYDIFGRKYRVYADDFIKRYYQPVHKAVAKGNKLKNDFRNRVKKLGLTHEESVLTQYLLEGKIDEYKQYIKVKKINLSQKQNAKIDKAVVEFRNIYNEIFSMINEAEIRNGIEPTEFRQNYAPHFSDNLSNHIIARVLNKAGFKITRSDEIPTSISGITEINKPKRQWFKHLQRRIGDKTIVDAVRGFDQYVDTACDVITLTDSIQRFRNFEDAIRYKHTDQGMQNAIEKIRNNKTLSYLQKQKKIDEIFENNTSNIERLTNLDGGNMGMRHFVTELRRYTDSLAGKKSRGDRSIEDDIGREIYQISKQTQNRVAADMIAGNISSWITNFIPLTQATGEIDLPNLFRGMRDTIKAYGNDDGFVAGSAFLTNRRGSKYLLQTNLQKVGGFLGTPMEFIDHFVADSIVRGRTYQNIDKGLDYDASIDEADAFAASLMADRSKGAMPGIFERQNPITKLFTMFQIEANNQLRYIGKDIYRRLGDYGGQAVATALASIFTTGYIYNNFYQMLTGRRSAFDPMGTIKETVQIVDDPERENSEKIQDVITLYAQQLPFVGGLLGGGRLPIGAVSPDFNNLLQVFNDNVAPEKRKEILIDELSNPIAYLMLPFGGGAAKKAYEGYNMIKNKGAYRFNNEGEEQLMFPAPGDSAKDYLQSMFFGQYSNKNGQNYINNGFQVLSPEYTKRYKRLISDEYGIDNTTAYDALMAVANAPSDEKRAVLMNTPLPADAKSYLDRTLFSYADSGNGIDYSDQDHFNITTQIDSDFLDNALYLYDNLGLNADEVINLIKTSSFENLNQVGSKKDQIFNILNNIYELNVSDDLKIYAYTEILAPQISEKFTTEQGKQLLEGVPMREAIRSYYMRDIINEEIDNDNTIHPLDKEDYRTLGWQNYLAENALEENMTFEQREKLRYFLANGQSDFEKTWDDYVYGGNEKERENIEALRNCGLDTLTYQVIKSGISGFKADKDANGEPIDDSKKNKVSAYFKQWNLTDEQYALMMKLQGYKVGSSSSKKKSSSSKKSSGGSNSKPKVKGGFKDFNGF